MKRTCSLLIYLAVIAGCLRLECPILANEYSYSVQGSFTYRIFRLADTGTIIEEEPLDRQFEVSVHNGTWRVKVVLVGNTNYDSFVYSFDGTNLSHFSIRTLGKSISGISLEASPVPRTITSAAGEYPWLAYASGSYLATVTNDLIFSFRSLNARTGYIKRFEVPCQVSLSQHPPYLPEGVTYFQKHSLFLGENGVIITNRLPRSFRGEGFISEVFSTGDFTNVNDMSFPSSFLYQSYQPRLDSKSSNTLYRTLSVEGRATNILVAPTPMLSSALPIKRLTVHDERHPEPNVTYTISNGVLPEVGSPSISIAREQAKVRLEKQIKIGRNLKSRATNISLLIAMIVIFAAPLVYYSFKRKGTVNRK